MYLFLIKGKHTLRLYNYRVIYGNNERIYIKYHRRLMLIQKGLGFVNYSLYKGMVSLRNRKERIHY